MTAVLTVGGYLLAANSKLFKVLDQDVKSASVSSCSGLDEYFVRIMVPK